MNGMSEDKPAISLSGGADIIRSYVKTLGDAPGVYRMLNAAGEPVYIGKARSLKKRVTTYTQVNKLPTRLQRMVSETASMEFIQTHTEVEALLLESNLIKQLKPRYNVLLRDDKSFPHILMTSNQDYPRIVKHRGAQGKRGEYFGPFASAGAVNRTLTALQKAFMLRNCTDSYFANRSRPCLQYHIKRCTAPCVGYVSREDYAAQVAEARAFLSGSSREIQDRYASAMQEASEALDYETAARYRDRIRALTAIQARQDVNVAEVGDADVMALALQGGRACVQVFFFRGGQNYGNRAYYPKHDVSDSESHILAAFMTQFYQARPAPPEILCNIRPDEHELIAEALNTRDIQRRKTSVNVPARGTRRRLVEFVERNAREALARNQARDTDMGEIFEELVDLFDLDDVPQRIEVYDNSHISGTNMVGVMIVATPDGFQKSAYRKFNIREAGAGDDYGMMREVMQRRFARALKDRQAGQEGEAQISTKFGTWPDLVLIDGGQGQLSAACDVFEELGITDEVNVAAIAKGVDRDAGREQFFLPGKSAFRMPQNHALLYFLQNIRDEAHRFAIGAHRSRRQKDITRSPLDEIAGIGPSRKKALLHHFGSARAVSRAGLADLEQVEGISAAMARQIYNFFHEDGG